MTRILSVFCLLCLTAATAAADDVHSVPLTLYPTAAPSPALKYPLLPELRDTIPGNAVTHYRKALEIMKRDAPQESEWYPMMDKWLAMPLKVLPRDEVSKFLKKWETTLQEVEAGARSENCDWELTERLRQKGIAVLPPGLHEMRVVGHLLQLRIRYELAEGHILKAVGTLRTGFAVARHVADAPSLIHAFAAMSIAAMMECRLEELIQQPDAPNFYWPLSDLPRPFINLRKPMQGERVQVYGSFPGMAEMAADLHAKPFTTEQIKKAVASLAFPKGQKKDWQQLNNETAMALRLSARHEEAKKILFDQGRPKELVDAMPLFQVALLVMLQQYDRSFDESQKWQNLPFWQSQPEMTKVSKRIDEQRDDKNSPAIPLPQRLTPQFHLMCAAAMRLERHLAALRCVEAVRLYAANHDENLPSSLEDVKDAPVSLDPATGKAFDYHVANDHAFLTCTPFPDQPPSNANTPSYELIIKHKGDQ